MINLSKKLIIFVLVGILFSFPFIVNAQSEKSIFERLVNVFVTNDVDNPVPVTLSDESVNVYVENQQNSDKWENTMLCKNICDWSMFNNPDNSNKVNCVYWQDDLETYNRVTDGETIKYSNAMEITHQQQLMELEDMGIKGWEYVGTRERYWMQRYDDLDSYYDTKQLCNYYKRPIVEE